MITFVRVLIVFLGGLHVTHFDLHLSR